jgi:uncharacterized protein YdaU (DUF1376 family)
MSKSLPWFPFFHDDYLDGTADLSLEEQGAYCRLLAFMYRNAGALQDDDNRIAHMLHVQVRPWRRIKAVLVAKGKLKITSAGIINARVMKVLEVQAAKAKKAKQSADTRWSVVPPFGECSGKLGRENQRKQRPGRCERIRNAYAFAMLLRLRLKLK